LGKNFPEEIQILTHDCHECSLLGYTTTQTPVQVNRHVLESDLKIGIGGIYPHPIAGFSGGGKLLVLGAGGYDTIRILHDQKKGSHDRNCNIDHEFRREVNEITRMIGYDFSINLVLNADREVAGVYCGDPEKSFKNGVEFYKEHFSIEVPESSDIVISDMYPFDTDFQYAFDRGLWPLLRNGKKTMRIILVSSPQGISNHVLFPVRNPLFTRLVRRMRNFHFRDITQLKRWISSIVDILSRRSFDYFVVSQSINQHDLKHVLPGGIQVETWNEMERLISHRFGSDSIKNVAIYKTAPLLLVHK
jgi:nickel-dependent lactate racemase